MIIRHSSSFFLSLILHMVILTVVFFIYEGVTHIKQEKQEKKLCVKLCTLVKEKPKPIIKKEPLKKVNIVKPKKKVQKHTPKPKVITKKKINKPKPKPQLKPKPKPKPKPNVKIIKEKPVVVPKIEKPKPVIYEEPKEDIYLDLDDDELYDDIEEDYEIENDEQRVLRLTKEYTDNHEDEIRQLINNNLYYPRRARKRRLQGEVKVKFKLSVDAEVSGIEVLSSKSDILSRAAIKTLNNLSEKFPKPSEELIIKIPILYKLK